MAVPTHSNTISQMKVVRGSCRLMSVQYYNSKPFYGSKRRSLKWCWSCAINAEPPPSFHCFAFARLVMYACDTIFHRIYYTKCLSGSNKMRCLHAMYTDRRHIVQHITAHHLSFLPRRFGWAFEFCVSVCLCVCVCGGRGCLYEWERIIAMEGKGDEWQIHRKPQPERNCSHIWIWKLHKLIDLTHLLFICVFVFLVNTIWRSGIYGLNRFLMRLVRERERSIVP